MKKSARSYSLITFFSILLTSVVITAAAEDPDNNSKESKRTTWAEKLGYPEGKKVIILHADDAGMSSGANIATAAYLEKNQIQSAAIMTPCPGADEFIRWAIDHPDTDVGMHLTHTSEWKTYRWGPVSDPAEVPGLVDPDGMLWHEVPNVVMHASADEVEKEIRAQIDKAIAMGYQPDHIDTHMGTLYGHASYVERFFKVAEEYGIPANVIDLSDPQVASQFKAAGYPIDDHVIGLIDQYALPKLDNFTSAPNGRTYEEKIENFKMLIRALPAGLTEIIFHPSVESEELKTITNSWQQRVWEAKMFSDPDLINFFREEGLIFTNWIEIMERFSDRQSNASASSDWISLFNGKDLDGWKVRGKAKWTVKGGIMIGKSEDGTGHLYTGPELTDLEVKGMFRISDQGGGGNSGLYFRANPPKDNPDGFPRGYEAQICHSQDAFTGWLWKPGTPTGKASALLTSDDEWFSMRVKATGSLIQIWVNDKLVMTHKDDEYKKGTFAIQCHNPGMTIESKELYYRDLGNRRNLIFKVSHMFTNRTLLSFVLLFLMLLSAHPQKDTEEGRPLKAPRGFRSEAIMKLSYALGFLDLIETEPAVPETIEVKKGIVYKQVDSISLQLDLYKPKNLNNPAPVLIFIHGGGWSKGERSDYLPYLIDYAEKGYITATVSYRLSGVAHYPAAVQDVQNAVQWIRAHAEEYMLNPEKIALIGGSAGGHLAMMVAYADETPDDKVQAVVNLYGPTDLTTEYARDRNECQHFLGKNYREAPTLYKEASPRTYISPDDPATLIFHGTIDALVPVSQSDSLHRWLDQAGIPNEYHRLKGWPHTMDLSKKVNDYCQYYMDAFFEQYLLDSLEPSIRQGL